MKYRMRVWKKINNKMIKKKMKKFKQKKEVFVTLKRIKILKNFECKYLKQYKIHLVNFQK